jgi:acetyl-CoA carboxylase biotin carboxylase subunit
MRRIRSVFIANRGEIAVRVIRTCRRLGIETVLGASSADLDSMAARLADRTICIGPERSADSYLNVEAVAQAARTARVDALHPGYGFLSENRSLAQACAQHGIIFIGPTEAQLDAVGDKLKARGHAVAASLPVVPGGEVADAASALGLAHEIGLPVLIKAVGGGGGRGMKPVFETAALADTIGLAMAEAQAAFGDPRVYLERFIGSGRHVEVQLLGDGRDVIHLGTRDCSIQRRYQKLVEEAPAPKLSDSLRESMHEAAVAFGRHLAYRGLGTVEFLVDCAGGGFYFLEMNARIQVEHPVTEAITGLDLVEEQIRVAEGRRLAIAQDQVRFSGHAIECRINAEDWEADFRPSPGRVAHAQFPVGAAIRIDTHMQPGAMVPPFYDSLLAKLIVHGADRGEAVQRLEGALARCRIEGVTTNLAMHQALCADPEFAAAGMDTGYFPRFLSSRR